MSAPKKRKSDVHNDLDSNDNAEHPHSKKEKYWFEETESENRRTSIFKGIFKKMRSSSTLKTTNTASTSKVETLANETQISITSESSVTSVESNATVPNVNKNAGLRTFVNRDSFTPVPPAEDDVKLDLPMAGTSKTDALSKMEDTISVNSHMSVDSTNTIDEDSGSIGSASVFCTPSRNPLNRSAHRMSTRSVPEWGDDQPALFRSLCNSAVRRVPTSKSEGGFGSTPMRRSMRMSLQKRVLNSTGMEDVPEEEALTISSSSALRLDAPIAEEEKFEGAKDFFANNVQTPTDEDEQQHSRLSTSSDARKSTGGSIGRKNSIFRKIFPGKHESKERRMSEVFASDIQTASEGVMPRARRASIVSFTTDCSFDTNNGVNSSASVSSLASNDSCKLKMRKKHPSTSNLTQRLSSVFRRASTSTNRDDESEPASRRNTLTGFSSISSGIGSIASGYSDSGFNTTGRSGQSISRSGSKREDENKRERSRRLLDRIIISELPAGELLKMKIEQIKRREHSAANEQFETQLNESDSSTSSQLNELLSFDVVAVDVHANGTPFSTVAATMIDEEIAKIVRKEVSYRPDRCGSITDCQPEMVFVCQEPSQNMARNANESISSNADTNTDLLRNVRNGLCKSLEEWKKISVSNESSTMLIYPMFCQSEAEWDSKATIDAIFMMLDGILQNARRWRPNGKCVLAGLTANNTRLLREKYDEVKQSVAIAPSVDELDLHSVTSNSTLFG